MLLPVFQDLIKPQWRAVLEELKTSGGLAVADLAKVVDASYMAVKQHCEELTALGYLSRSRVPRTGVGRPEIFYTLSAKTDALFPQMTADFALQMFNEIKATFGENAPEKLLFQHFQKQQVKWQLSISKTKSLVEKATKLAALRTKEGCFVKCKYDPAEGFRIEEYHNPLQRIFEAYPRAIPMEHRMIEQLLGTKVTRREMKSARSGQPRVIFEVPTLGMH